MSPGVVRLLALRTALTCPQSEGKFTACAYKRRIEPQVASLEKANRLASSNVFSPEGDVTAPRRGSVPHTAQPDRPYVCARPEAQRLPSCPLFQENLAAC